MGRIDIFLKLEVVKKGLSVLALLIGMQFDVYIMVSIKAFQDFLCTFVNAAPNKKLLGYSIFDQWRDVMPPAILAAVMCAVVMAAGKWLVFMPLILRLSVQIVIGVAVYAALAGIFRLESFRYCLEGVRSVAGGRKNGQ